eukprot:Opistho-1_new@14787
MVEERSSDAGSVDSFPSVLITAQTTASSGKDARDSETWDSTPPYPRHYIPRRYVIVAMTFLGLFVSYLLRCSISSAIDDMADSKDWSNTQQGIVLSSFFYGYIVTQIPCALLARRYGGKHVLGFGILIGGIFSVLTPIAVEAGLVVCILGRVGVGLTTAVSYPVVHDILGRWVPSSERALSVGFVWSGSYIATGASLGMSPPIIEALHWQSVFYLYAGFAATWFVLWQLLTSSGPRGHRSIAPREVLHIEASLPKRFDGGVVGNSHAIPWGVLLRRPPVYALLAGHFSNNWAAYTLMTYMPKYMKDVLGYDFKNAGVVSVLPYLALFSCCSIAGRTADAIVARKVLRVVNVRRLMQAIGSLVPAACLVMAGFAETSTVATVLIVVAVGVAGFNAAGYGANALDLAPEFAGILLSMSNAFATIPGIVSPTLTGFILDEFNCVDNGYPQAESCHTGWRIVFGIAAGVYIVGWLVFCILCSSDPVIARPTEHQRLLSGSVGDVVAQSESSANLPDDKGGRNSYGSLIVAATEN